MAFLRESAPNRPMLNYAAEKNKYQESGIISFSYFRLNATYTAPTMAASSNTDATSNGRT